MSRPFKLHILLVRGCDGWLCYCSKTVANSFVHAVATLYIYICMYKSCIKWDWMRLGRLEYAKLKAHN